MGKLTEKEILHIAKLAKLNLTSEEIKKFGEQLSKVIEYVGQLKEVNTKDVRLKYNDKKLENIYRDDVIRKENSLTVEEALSGTENYFNNYFKVKAIFEE